MIMKAVAAVPLMGDYSVSDDDDSGGGGGGGGSDG